MDQNTSGPIESILDSIKKHLGIDKDYDHFDPELIMDINTVFTILTQMGVGPPNGFYITGDTEKWTDFTYDEYITNQVETYVYLKVRLMFDPPSSSPVIDAINRQISELEYRAFVTAEFDS